MLERGCKIDRMIGVLLKSEIAHRLQRVAGYPRTGGRYLTIPEDA